MCSREKLFILYLYKYIFFRKRWILFPPETGGLKPTRVPYEESSVYSELNFYCPSKLDEFSGKVNNLITFH